QRISLPASWHGGPAARVYSGRVEALPFRLAYSLYRVFGKPCQIHTQDRSGNDWSDKLQRMDRRTALVAAERSRRAKGSVMGRIGRIGGNQRRGQHSDSEGDGRLHRGLWAERRGAASSKWFSSAANCSRL